MSNAEATSDWVHLHSASERNPFFGEVQHRLLADGTRDVKLIIQPDTELGFELARAALAIDGSKSMMQPFAAHLPPMLRKNKNAIHPTVQPLATYLAENAKGEVAVAYWACGDDGGDIEPIGIMTKDDFNTDTNVDVWDHKWLDEMADMSDIFVEMVQDWTLGVGGYIEADGAKVLETDEFKFGVQFQIPASASSFTMHLNDVGDYEQALA